ncbi:MAG: Sec-independent protein translocase protein TatB [Desulfobacterales bacterium]|jgi:Tat protein translocase TatB subunit|nr:Sec-independent protein translocase protein TatB [Desulfobacterales bacterium]
MFGIGMPELILIAVVALIVLGPKRLPDLAKSMGRAVREFKKATSELKETLQVDGEFTEVKKAFTDFHADVNKTIHDAEKPPANPAAAPPALPADSAPPADPGPAEAPPEPGAEQKLEDLKKAFEAWSSGKPSPPDQNTDPPRTAAAPPTKDETKPT